MGTTYRIADVAERSGFTPATLRYYEDIGLMAPVGRTAAGYRIYDDASLDRLRFIARAKQLGCSLDEIAELATAWDAGSCAPVQARLRAAVEGKIADSQTRMAELTALTADLRRAAAVLSGPAAAGACDDTCGCTGEVAATASGSGSVRTGVALVTKAEAVVGAPAEPPIACTLDGGAMGQRVEEWQTLLTGDGAQWGVARRRPIDGGVRLEFRAGTELADIVRLATLEHDCCLFFRFAVTVDDRGVALEVRAPADAAELVASLFGAPA